MTKPAAAEVKGPARSLADHDPGRRPPGQRPQDGLAHAPDGKAVPYPGYILVASRKPR